MRIGVKNIWLFFTKFSVTTFFQKYFSFSKNGQKKCPKMKKGERLLKKHEL